MCDCLCALAPATAASLVTELSTARPKARFLLGSPCESVYIPLFVGYELGLPQAGDRFAALISDHRATMRPGAAS